MIQMVFRRGKWLVSELIISKIEDHFRLSLVLGFMDSMPPCNSHMPQYTGPNFYTNLSPPPPPPPRRMNCGELREHHNGTQVELHGRVNRSRLGRFIELKDQHGVIQLVAPVEVCIHNNKLFATVMISNNCEIIVEHGSQQAICKYASEFIHYNYWPSETSSE